MKYIIRMNIKKKNPLNSNSYKDINNNQLQNEDYDYNNEEDDIDINNLFILPSSDSFINK